MSLNSNLSQKPEILSSNPPPLPFFFENLVGGSPLPTGGAHYEVCSNLKIMAQLIWAPLLKSWNIYHEIDASFTSSLATNAESDGWQHQNLNTFDIFTFHIKCIVSYQMLHFISNEAVYSRVRNHFADHLSSLLFIFCSFNFILALLFHFVPT